MDITRLWSEANKKAQKAAHAPGSPGSAAAPGQTSARPALRHLPAGRSPDDLCADCRRNGRVYCPHRPILALKAELASSLNKQDFFGPSPPNMFVGHYGWPQINWGPTLSLAEGIPDNPKDWYGWDFDQIVRARSLMVRGMSKSSVRAASHPASPGLGREAPMLRMLSDAQEAAMSVSPLDLEMHFSKKPDLRVELHAVHQPMGPSAPLERLRLADNARIPGKLDELVEEKVPAHKAVVELLHSGFDEHYLTRLLTAGVLGKPERKKLVPTRWGITAVDDMMAQEHMYEVRQMRQSSEFMLFSNEYLANRFHILLLPGAWEYEGFEAWCGPLACQNATPVHLGGDASNGQAGPGGSEPSSHFSSFAISEEHEPYEGRTAYAHKQGGGYYAARLGVAEALATRLKRQARALVIREILPEYDLPVGVWQIRQSVREAFKNPVQKFQTFSEAIAGLHTQLKLPLSEYLKRSRLLSQKRLSDF